MEIGVRGDVGGGESIDIDGSHRNLGDRGHRSAAIESVGVSGSGGDMKLKISFRLLQERRSESEEELVVYWLIGWDRCRAVVRQLKDPVWHFLAKEPFGGGGGKSRWWWLVESGLNFSAALLRALGELQSKCMLQSKPFSRRTAECASNWNLKTRDISVKL